MDKFIDTLKSIWKIKELRDRVLLTLALLAVYRFGAQVALPGVDSNLLAEYAATTEQGILGLLNAFTGGAFSKISVFALGIMPYISASIIVQLMGIAIPYLQKLDKEGESGRKTKTQITRWLTILICLVQAPTYLLNLGTLGVPDEAFILGKGWDFLVPSVIILVAGCIFAMWLGEKITDRGIGNGISILITVGIIATFPQSFWQEVIYRNTGDNGGPMLILVEVILWFVVILACVLVVTAIRQIPVQYARRSASGGYEKNAIGARQYIPLKLNSSGVMPIIFAQAIMFAPALLGKSINDTSFGAWMETNFSDIFGFAYNTLFAILIIIFTFFYTAITVPTNKMADDLKRSGGFIPGIRPGKETGDYLDRIMSLITLPGSIFLAALAVLPAVFNKVMDMQAGWAIFYGGTSLLIMVGVAIDTIQQVNSYLLNRHYDGLMKTGKQRKSA
jgi:preprotein translocase subunit SecY